MSKIYKALGLMSGTSMDGVDASIVSADDGKRYFYGGCDKYFKYDDDLYQKLTKIRDKIHTSKDLKSYSKELKSLEKELTLFHAKVSLEMIKSAPEMYKPNLIGFHGQTIYHNPDEKITVQLGDGRLLSQLTKKTVVYDFRKNDIKNGGQGAPLTPIFHNYMTRKIYEHKEWPILVLNIGGISNVTSIPHLEEYGEKDYDSRSDSRQKLFAEDIGPGNCLIDEWVRKNSNYRFDKNGLIAKSGKVNQLILDQVLDNFRSDETNDPLLKRSMDIKDYDISFVRGLSLEDGAATLTHFTANLICNGLINFMLKNYKDDTIKKSLIKKTTCLVCGGGRKNKYLMKILKENLKFEQFISIDEVGPDGDFIESSAFAYLAIRSVNGLPLTFPNTTGCKESSTGGVIVKNF